MTRTRLQATLAVLSLLFPALLLAAQIDISGPAGSGAFGQRVTLLPNGNFVVTDPLYDAPGGAADVGAVHLYRPDGSRIYTVRGSSADDQIGSGYVTVLSNGNFVVVSPNWDNGSIFDAGAATWCNGSSGSDAVVSVSNSLVGGSASNRVGGYYAVALTNGNYVVVSYEWDSSGVIDAGAVTWGNGTVGTHGIVSAANSLVGSSADDNVGWGSVTALSNGNYVVSSPKWNNGSAVDAGAATWGSGVSGITGAVSAGNSFVGSTSGDQIGDPVLALQNGNYVAGGYYWDNGSIVNAGAVAWGNGATGGNGVIGTGNALVGSSANDNVGGYVYALRNGHYVINSPDWDNGATIDAGASTWVNGNTGATGTLGLANSLIGGAANNRVGAVQITELTGGDYIVGSPFWDNGVVVDAGAVTRRSGTSSSSGTVSASNSLVGSTTGDKVGNYGPCGYGSTALSNGHYVVRSSEWNNGAIADVGAVTWRDGNSTSGAVVSASNSLIGSTAGDQVGCRGVTALSNGNYVVNSPSWDNGTNANAGAATWRNGTSSAGGVVTTSNSQFGNASDNVGFDSTALSNGNYVVRNFLWKNGTAAFAGAITWGNGMFGTSGLVNAFDSLVGTTAQDYVGNGVIFAQQNGNYIGYHPNWNNGALQDAGAISLSFGDGSTVGAITAINSVRGTVADAGNTMNYAYDSQRAQLIVGRPASNIVSLLRPGTVTNVSIVLDTPDPSALGEVVTFVATLVAMPVPNSGSVRMTADSGETCTDTSPTPTGVSSAQFSCQIVFTHSGSRSVRAEFLGTNSHGYSASGVETHTIDLLFADGFE
ncbi:MAG: hypothetical protein ABI411_03205 [Tahibacter sp.]